jgi:hypothetical protein
VDLVALQLSELVIHQVPKSAEKGAPASAPTLSEVADPQTAEVRGYFESRLQAVMTDHGFPIERDSELDAAGFDAVTSVFNNQEALVPASQFLAKRLFKVQDRRNPDGILVVGHGDLRGERVVTLLKLEHERGVRAERESTAEGLVFRIVLHKDLMLTAKTKVFKAAVFRRNKDGGLEGMIADQQVEHRAAGFFLEEFLGCQLVRDPAVSTAEYFDAAESFIGTVSDPERKARYEMALLSQMHSSAVKVVDPVRFADEHLAPETHDHQRFLDHLNEKGVSEQRFSKDVSEIKGRIKRMAFDFDSGIKLFGAPEAIDEHVEIESDADQQSVAVTVRDGLNQIHSRG